MTVERALIRWLEAEVPTLPRLDRHPGELGTDEATQLMRQVAGFLPADAGNIRERPLTEIYRTPRRR
jgi:hypothetical protein